MNTRNKREIRNKARLAFCLVDILEYDAYNLRSDANECDPDRLSRTLQDMRDTVQNLSDLVAEMEYVLYLNELKGI